jgi:tRNA pseudouridine55 synthase
VRRRRQDRREAVDGILLLDKPAGMTSNQALQQVRRMLNARKAGHTGSLDPSATGMLPLCFGEATKVCAFLLDADKTYRVTARLGEATNTGDADGDVTTHEEVPELTAAEWQGILDGFLGDSLQVPPMYSALKKDGKRLYELARKGEIVEREPRPIRIYSIQLMEVAGTRLVFRVKCSKGTYVRSLVEDIAKRAGTVAHTARLHRESVGDFESGGMLDMAALEAAAEQGKEVLRARLSGADAALTGLPAIRLSAEGRSCFLRGQAISCPGETASGIVRVYGATEEFLGVGEVTVDGELAPRRVFNTGEKNP